MKRVSRLFRPEVLTRWCQVTESLGYGERSQTKLLLMLLDYAERNPDLFRKR